MPTDSTASGRRILVADDNTDSAGSMAMILRILGHDARTAHDGLQVVEVATTFRPDVILLDIGMPELDGYEVCRRIRGEPWGSEISIIALTGWGGEEDRKRSLEAGFDHHLVKPVDPIEVEKLLAGSRA
jgi:CheY-like chemotaxis protein